jgi:hypothetical protein
MFENHLLARWFIAVFVVATAIYQHCSRAKANEGVVASPPPVDIIYREQRVRQTVANESFTYDPTNGPIAYNGVWRVRQ